MFCGVYKAVLDIMKSIDEKFSIDFDKFISKLPVEIETKLSQSKDFAVEFDGVSYQMSSENNKKEFIFSNKQEGKKVVVIVNDYEEGYNNDEEVKLGTVIAENEGYDIIYNFTIKRTEDRYDAKMEKFVTSDYICIEKPITTSKSISHKEIKEVITKAQSKKIR